MRRRILIGVAILAWIGWLLLLDPPMKWEDLTPEELLRHDIDATVIF